MARLDISKSELGDVGTKALAEGLKGNQIMLELNISSNSMGKLGAIALADIIPDMGAISSINLLKNHIPVEQAQELVKIMQAKENLTTMCGLSKEETELDFSSQHLNAGDAVLIANDIIDMGGISSVNLLKNDIGVAQAEDLVNILKDHPTLESLCGNKGNETALDMSGKMKGAADAIMLVAEIIDNGAVLKLTFGERQVVTMTTVMTEANFGGKLMSYEVQIVAAFLPQCT
jgi:hypothetical protein